MTAYGVTIADPPWCYGNAGVNGSASGHYPTMSTEEICDLKPPSADDAVLFLWATWPLLFPDAALVIEAWGYEYKSGFFSIKLADAPFTDMWGEQIIKPSFGTGWWVRGCSELVLIGVRGKAKAPETPFLGLLCERMQHSRKPDNLYEMAEQHRGPYLELFARRERAGWDQFGDEVGRGVELTKGVKGGEKGIDRGDAESFMDAGRGRLERN